MKPNLSLKFLEGVTEKLREENSDLRKEVESLRGVVGSLEQELRTLSIIVSENIERREAVETSLVAVEQNYTDLLENQRKMSTAIELQAQYSRKKKHTAADWECHPYFRAGGNHKANRGWTPQRVPWA